MGNDASQLKGLEIDEKPTETTDLWCQYKATIRDSCRYFGLNGDGLVSVFKGETIIGPLWAVSTPLEKFCNNILKYRHPFIVRYISAWQQRSTFHLATEYVQPLAHTLTSQTPLQKCIGLNNILQALVFLHEQGGVSHNNLSISSIYVSGDGQWKLGGLQYLCSFSELTPAYLKQSRIHRNVSAGKLLKPKDLHQCCLRVTGFTVLLNKVASMRYDKAVDPNEDSNQITTKVDHYAIAVLVEDVFKGCNDDEVPYLREFKMYCRECLQNSDCNKRPNLSDILQHDFFNHEFISVYKFLSYLPLKGGDEKMQFFTDILKSLKCYDEETVAKQFGGLLLSRLTLLDQTARKNVIPYILRPRNERTQNGEHCGFFSVGVFKEHLKPRVIQLFSVRDSQIRLLLLTHFSKYVNVFSHEELAHQILPELLLGIKDIDDALVSATLVCLSELVPILGADTVVGGKRAKLFTDGRPNSNDSISASSHEYEPKKSLQNLPCSEGVFSSNIKSSMFDQTLLLNERPSPVGGESIDVENTQLNLNYKNESEEDWDDWGNTNRRLVSLDDTKDDQETSIHSNLSQNTIIYTHEEKAHSVLLQKASLDAKNNIIDISELDIKNKVDQNRKDDDFDFFADMTPIIEKQKVVPFKNEIDMDLSSKLNFVPINDEDENVGWEDTWND